MLHVPVRCQGIHFIFCQRINVPNTPSLVLLLYLLVFLPWGAIWSEKRLRQIGKDALKHAFYWVAKKFTQENEKDQRQRPAKIFRWALRYLEAVNTTTSDRSGGRHAGPHPILEN